MKILALEVERPVSTAEQFAARLKTETRRACSPMSNEGGVVLCLVK
jgi:hypothetical protein